MTCICIPPDLVRQVWPHVRTLIYGAIERGNLSGFAPVEQAVLSGGMLLWCATDGTVVDAAAVTEITQTEWRKVCVLVACGGVESSKWLHLIETIEQYAKAEGCSALRIFGRKGWARKLPDYIIRRIVLEKGLS